VGHPKCLAAALLAKIIVSRVNRQPIQPRLKDLCRPQLVERKIKPQENFLCDILDIFRTGDQPGDRAQNPLPVHRHDFVESSAIALLCALDQLEINQHSAPYVPASKSFKCSIWIGVPAS